MTRQKYEQQVRRGNLPTIWKVPDAMWQHIQDLFPPPKAPGTPGRPPVPYRVVLNGILYVLRTGCQWKAVPAAFSSGSTVHRRFQEWVVAQVLDAVLRAMLRWYQVTRGIAWRWQAVDTKLLAAPLGGELTGRNPTDRGKSGTKRHLLVDGRGVPLAFHLTGAQRHDMKGLAPLVTDGWLITRPRPDAAHPQHICLDKGYDYPQVDELLDQLDYHTHIRRRGEAPYDPQQAETVYPARRWKVERSISWLNNMRKLRTRWEKKAANYRGLWLLAAALLCYRRIVLG